MARSAVKDATRGLVRTTFSVLPFSVALRLAALNKHLYNQLPGGHTLRFDRYHGSLTVEVDTVYPIERQMLSGEYDSETARVIRRYVRPGGCVIDVGANVGAHTLLMAQLVGNTGQVIAFEPGPPIFERLQHNLNLNPGSRQIIVAEMLGLSDEPGLLSWNEYGHNRGNAHLRQSSGIGVTITTLDEYLASHQASGPISFVKIDVEGMELQVLRGSRELLHREHPALYFETLPGARSRHLKHHGEDLFAIIEAFLADAGYRTFRVDDRGERHRVNADSFATNTLALYGADVS